MITVAQAFERIMAQVKPLATERLAVAKSSTRVLAAPLAARRSQPAANLSAMDGYAVRTADLAQTVEAPVEFKVIGEVGAGDAPAPAVRPGTSVRIFTGGVLPKGADQVVIQEDCTREGDRMVTHVPAEAGRHIRPMGGDFLAHQTLLEAGTLLTPKSLGLAAAAGHGHVMVHRAARVAIIATGNEVVDPDTSEFSPAQIADSASPMVAALLQDSGAELILTDRIGDDLAQITAAIQSAAMKADLVITIGGASVGARDHVGAALDGAGFTRDFWKIAMRPGKPLMMAHKEGTIALGLPGNAVSAFVCSLLFARPVVDAMMGRPAPLPVGIPVPLASDLPQGGPRTHYMRARLVGEPGGPRLVDAAIEQDSAMTSVLAAADGLIVRDIDAPAAKAGDKVAFLPF